MTQAFRSLLIHTCTIQRIQIVERSGESYGHKTRNERVIVSQDLMIPCRMHPLSPEERQELWLVNQVRAQYSLYMVYESLPSGLTPWGGWSEFQVVSVAARASGSLIDSGPLDITMVENQAGETHHAKLMVLRGK